jgi:4-nitrophenyl phosphatase
MSDPAAYNGYLVDIEGVLVRDKRYQPVTGSVEWLNELPGKGIRFCLVSNNTTHRPEGLVSELNRVGFQLETEQLVSALDLGADLLLSWGKRRLLWLGVGELGDYWVDRGFELVETGECDAVVLGANPGLRTGDLDRALAALADHSAELVALHRNPFYLDRDGERRLGPGAWCAALETVARCGKAVCVGKPEMRIYREGLKRLGTTAGETLFISDDPVSDLVTAKRLGMATAFTLSGKFPDHKVLETMNEELWPDIICDRPDSLG